MHAITPFVVLALIGLVAAPAFAQPTERWVHPQCKPLDIAKNGPFIQLDDGALMTVDKNQLRTSTDAGKTWSEPGPVIYSGINIGHAGHVGQLLRTKAGTLIILYLDFDGYKWSWNDENKAPNPECKLELWAIRSTDNGQTWTDRQQLLEGYNADFMGLIQTSAGPICATVEHLMPELARWVACSFYSDDEGKTWKRSNWIDLGGHGHHDGAVEPCVTELGDGRLMMLIRTSLDQFWRAYSEDNGRYWRIIEPSGIDASSAPGWLLRLHDGALAFVYNQSKPEGAAERPKGASGGQASEFPISWYREELSLTFSTDDGKTWSRPTVIARQPKGQLAYPYLHEPTPGTLWIFTRYTFYQGGKTAPPLAVQINVEDFK